MVKVDEGDGLVEVGGDLFGVVGDASLLAHAVEVEVGGVVELVLVVVELAQAVGLTSEVEGVVVLVLVVVELVLVVLGGGVEVGGGVLVLVVAEGG